MQLPHIVKQITRPLVGRVPVTIAGGPNRGLKWSLASSGNGFKRGTREPERMDHLKALVHPGDVVWDVGAHYGYVTLLLARLAGESGRVHSFEPAKRSRWYLSRHVRWNGLHNVTVHPFALADFDGTSSFGGADSSQLFALGAGDERVGVRRGDGLVRAGVSPPPTFVKVDVEGAEVNVIEGIVEVLRPATRLFVAMHSLEKYRGCIDLMRSLGYEAHASTELERTALAAVAGSGWSGDPDALFVGPGYRGTENDLRMLRAAGF